MMINFSNNPSEVEVPASSNQDQSWIAAAIGAAVSIGSAIWQSAAAKKQNKRQREQELQDYERNKADNSPAAQMQRLSEAGLNPNLVYGSGADAKVSPVSNRSRTDEARYVPDLGSIASNALSIQQMRAQVGKTEAETKAIQVQTGVAELDYKVKQAVGFDAMVKELDSKLAASSSANIKAIREFETWLDLAFSTSGGTDINVDRFGSFPAGSTLIQTAQKAGLEELITRVQSLKQDVVLKGLAQTEKTIEIELLRFKDRLREFGISSESTQALGILVGILRTLFK